MRLRPARTGPNGFPLLAPTLTAAVTAALVLLAASPALAQDPAAGVDTASAEYQQWEADLQDARAQRSRGQTFFWAGLGASAASSALFWSLNPGTWQVGALISTAGGVGAIYGLVNWVQGANRVDNLKREGRREGYITLGPAFRGRELAGVRVGVRVPVSFGR